LILPKRFFITSGRALSAVSKLNAFDQALMNAGIAHCNLVPVSSIIPKGSVKIDYYNIEAGAITFGSWLRLSMEALIEAGYKVVIGEEHINVYVVKYR
jgi:arginine decarboxylase